MEEKFAVVLENVSKIYILKSKKDRIKKRFYALKNINLSIPKGQVVGILGTNGSGKSTLSALLAGISTPDFGTIRIDGESALVAINVGLNKNLTGLENIELKGALLGLRKKRIKEITQGVIDFAEIGDFLYQPVKKYSSGMKSRLGFAINLYLDSEILIIDEALSVGDNVFSQKCIAKMNELKISGKTIFFISHSITQIKGFCDTCVWIEGGLLKDYGETVKVCSEYQKYSKEYTLLTPSEKKEFNKTLFENRVV